MPELPSFRVSLEQDGDTATLIVSGDVDIATIHALERARTEALADGPQRVVIDLGHVEFIDSSGLKFLLDTDRMARARGFELALRKPAERAMRVFTVTGADVHLPFID